MIVSLALNYKTSLPNHNLYHLSSWILTKLVECKDMIHVYICTAESHAAVLFMLLYYSCCCTKHNVLLYHYVYPYYTCRQLHCLLLISTGANYYRRQHLFTC